MIALLRRPAGFAAIALLGGCLGGTTFDAGFAGAPMVTVMTTPAAAASLIAATSGEQLANNLATGERAQLINAAMPFSTAPLMASCIHHNNNSP